MVIKYPVFYRNCKAKAEKNQTNNKKKRRKCVFATIAIERPFIFFLLVLKKLKRISKQKDVSKSKIIKFN
jgi:hypothetical protein